MYKCFGIHTCFGIHSILRLLTVALHGRLNESALLLGWPGALPRALLWPTGVDVGGAPPRRHFGVFMWGVEGGGGGGPKVFSSHFHRFVRETSFLPSFS